MTCRLGLTVEPAELAEATRPGDNEGNCQTFEVDRTLTLEISSCEVKHDG